MREIQMNRQKKEELKHAQQQQGGIINRMVANSSRAVSKVGKANNSRAVRKVETVNDSRVVIPVRAASQPVISSGRPTLTR